MSHSSKTTLTPSGLSSLNVAQNAVTEAFRERDPEQMLWMLRYLCGIPGKPEIQELARKTTMEINNLLKLEYAPSHQTEYVQYAKQMKLNTLLMEKLMEFHYQVRLIFSKYDLNEYAKIKPRDENTPTI